MTKRSMVLESAVRIFFEAGVECSSKTMYPDWLSMSGAGYISSMYKKYKKSSARWDAVLF